jgi:hypothetical protein
MFGKHLNRVCSKFRLHNGLQMGIDRVQRNLSIGAMSNILQPHHLDIVKDERVMFSKLFKSLVEIKSDDEVLKLVTDTQSRIDDLFLVVVVGEFNSGKSTFVNSLLGLKLLREGILPTTDSIYIIRSGNSLESTAAWKQVASMTLEDVKDVVVPAGDNNPWLDNIAIVDTPGMYGTCRVCCIGQHSYPNFFFLLYYRHQCYLLQARNSDAEFCPKG